MTKGMTQFTINHHPTLNKNLLKLSTDLKQFPHILADEYFVEI